MENEVLSEEESAKLNELEEKLRQRNEVSVFENRPVPQVPEPNVEDNKHQLVEKLFEDGIKYQIQNNTELQDKVLDSAKTFVETKSDIIKTNVDTEKKEAVYNNNKDACESYGFNEKTTPTWAVKFMKVGYSIILGIWLFIGSFTFMPVIFVAKKISVALKHTWLAVLFAILIYIFVVVGIPLIISFVR